MFKPCPKCKKLSNVETRICTCGFWFIENKLAQTSPDFRQTKREKLKKSAFKFLILTSFVIFVCAAAAVLWGFTDFFQSSENDKENSSPVDPSGNSQNTSSAARFPKGRVEGKVTAVESGDLITILDSNNKEYKVRLGGIDAPEPEQDFGQQSKENLAALILDKNVVINLQKIDEGGVLVGKVIFENRNINFEQIKSGFAWNDKNSAEELLEDARLLYADAENTARTERAGIWSNTITTLSETPTATPDSPANPETVSGNKDAVNPEIAPQFPPVAKSETPESRTENSLPSGFTTITPASSPSPTVSQPTPNVAVTNIEPKPANKSAAAIARCADGTLSYSVSRSGACSNHGGVAGWLDGSNSPTKTKPSERTYIRGSRGGCYYLNPNGRKTYVDQSLCN